MNIIAATISNLSIVIFHVFLSSFVSFHITFYVSSST
nr:MAG TPA: hypothetical protein [Crassvirales sp.]